MSRTAYERSGVGQVNGIVYSGVVILSVYLIKVLPLFDKHMFLFRIRCEFISVDWFDKHESIRKWGHENHVSIVYEFAGEYA